MANPNVHLFTHDRALANGETRADRPAGIGGILSRLYGEFSVPGHGEAAVARPMTGGATQLAFLSRCVVLQAIGAALLVALWIGGLAGKPFEGDNGFLCWLIVAIAALGIACVFLQRWRDMQWIATHVVRIGLLGTVVGLIIAFSAARSGASADPNQIRPMIAAVVDGMYVSLYATLLGIGTNLWLKVNMRLLGHIDG
jgi:MotA/TolQ/ExbB proton channel family